MLDGVTTKPGAVVLFTRKTLISADLKSRTIATFPFGFKSQNGDLEN